jgi:hypothetical protein
MKKAIILFVCVGAMFCSFAQETPPGDEGPFLTKQEYLQKSKAQRTGAIVMVSAGGALAIAGLILAVENLGTDIGNDLFPNTPGEPKKNEALSAVLLIAGVGAMLGSIGLFRSARKNKQKALSVTFKNELSPQLQKSLVVNRYVPSLTFKISL